MGIAEPTGPLWAAVTAVYDPWPPDDETVAADLGAAWLRGDDVLVAGAGESAAANGAVSTSWADRAGAAFHARVDESTRALDQAQQQMLVLAARGDHYASELASAKSTISSAIAANEQTYALLGNPLLGALGQGLQQAFAGTIAVYLHGMIAEKAAALRGNPAGAPLPAQPPPDPPEADGLDDFVGDRLRDAGAFNQLAWRAEGEAGDDVLDGIGETGGDALRAVGNFFGSEDLIRQGDEFQADLDTKGDRVAEALLGVGADGRIALNNAATAVDGDVVPLPVYISPERYPQSAAHINDAKSGTSYRGGADTAYTKQQPSVLTIDRNNAKQNRADSLRGVPTETGYDRDEYPPAVFKQGGEGASVKYINPSDNRGAGASMGAQMRNYTPEDSIDRQSTRLGEGQTVILVTE